MLKKSFGQHFLKDPTVVDQIIAAAAIQPNELVVEVGPGAGALTERLIEFPPPFQGGVGGGWSCSA